jgi:hypothetical protein
MTYAVSVPGSLRFHRPSLHVWRQPQGIDMREWTAPSAHERAVSISVRPEVLIEQFFTSSTEVPERLRAFVSPSRSRIDFCQFPLSVQMIDLTTKATQQSVHRRTCAQLHRGADPRAYLCGYREFWRADRSAFGGILRPGAAMPERRTRSTDEAACARAYSTKNRPCGGLKRKSAHERF